LIIALYFMWKLKRQGAGCVKPALRDALRQVYVDTDWQRLSNSQPMLVPMLEVQGEITRTVEKIEKLIDRGEKS